MPMTRRGRSWPGEAGDHAGLGGAGDAADDDGVEEDPELVFLLLYLVGPVREAETAEPVVGGPGRDGVRGAARGADVLERLLPAGLEADAEARVDQAHVRAHDPGEQDVADPVVDRVGPVDPALLDEPGPQAQPGGDRGDLAGVIGLHPADRDQRVGALGQRIGDQVLQLAGLVAAEGEPGVAVLPLGPDLRPRPGERTTVPAGGSGWDRIEADNAGSHPGTPDLQGSRAGLHKLFAPEDARIGIMTDTARVVTGMRRRTHKCAHGGGL